MINVIATWELLETKQPSFARTLENWFRVSDPEENERRLAALRDPSTYADGRAPDFISISPFGIKLSLEVVSDSPPRAYISIGGRGNYLLPLKDLGPIVETVYTVRVFFGKSLTAPYTDVEVVVERGASKEVVAEMAKTKARIQNPGGTPSSVEILSSTQRQTDRRKYSFSYVIPFTTPTKPKDPIWATIFVYNELGELYSERKSITILEQKLSPALNKKDSEKFFAEIVERFFNERGISRVIEELRKVLEPTKPAPGRDDIAYEFQQWFKQRAAPMATRSGLESIQQSILDELIRSHRAINNPKYCYDAAGLVYEINMLCATDWSERLIREFLADVRSGEWKSDLRVKADFSRTKTGTGQKAVVQISDPGSQYGDTYLVVIPENERMYIVGEDGSIYPIVEYVPDETPSEGDTDPQKKLRESFERFLAIWDSAIVTTKILYEWATQGNNPLGQIIPYGEYHFPKELRFVPVLSEAKWIGLKLPDIMSPALGEPGAFSSINMSTLEALLRDTVFAQWSGELFRRFGDVRTFPEWRKLDADAKEIMQIWGFMSQANKDSRMVMLEIPKNLEWRNYPELVYAYTVMYRNASQKMVYERLPYDRLWFFPPLWWPQRIRRYLGLDATYRDLTSEAAWKLGVPPLTSGPYWTSTIKVGDRVMNAFEQQDYLNDLLARLRQDPANVPLNEIIQAEQLCWMIYESTEARKRFESLFNTAVFVLKTINPSAAPEINPATRDRYLGQAQAKLFEFKAQVETDEEILRNIVKALEDAGIVDSAAVRLHKKIFEEKDKIIANIHGLVARNPEWSFIFDILTEASKASVRVLPYPPEAIWEELEHYPKSVVLEIRSGSPQEGEEGGGFTWREVPRDSQIFQFIELAAIHDEEKIKRYLDIIQSATSRLEMDLNSIGISAQFDRSVLSAPLSGIFGELFGVLEKAGSSFSKTDLDEFVKRVDSIKDSIGRAVAERMNSVYVVDADVLLERLSQYKEMLSKESLIDMFLRSPHSEVLQQMATAVNKKPEEVLSEIRDTFFGLVTSTVVPNLATAIFKDFYTASAAVEKELKDAWRKACSSALRGISLGYDPLAFLHQIDLYFGSGYTLFHLGQRAVTKLILGIF